VTGLALPAGEGVRIESGVVQGTAVTVHYDPLLMKLVTKGSTRAEAVARMTTALDACVVDGVRTTLPFLRQVVRHDAFLRGKVHTQMVEQGAFHD
jgi:acetyl/propionyl-CoA carboxylase alpha subunit